jgi:uncharacterized protein (TIGR03437 family)
VALDWQGATWSRKDPDLIFVHVSYYNPNYPATGMKLYSYRPSTNVFTLLKDFAPELAPGQPDYLFEMHIAQDGKDDTFTFMQNRVGYPENPLYFIVWKRSTNTVLQHISNDTTFDANAALPDKSGRWVFFPLNKTQPDLTRHRTLDLQTNTWQTTAWTSADDAPSHGDVGTGTLTGRGNWSGGFNLRSLNNVHSRTILFDNKDAKSVLDWTNDQHTSLYADDESWVMLGLYDDPAETVNETGAFENEVMQIAMDGSQRIRRLFHHRSHIDNLSETTGYWAVPKPTISKDGRFIAFTSNWGETGRYDLYIAKIEPDASIPLATPVPTPSSTPPAPTPSPTLPTQVGSELIWVDDALPANAVPGMHNESWNWLSSNPGPYSGTSATQTKVAAGLHQQTFSEASETMSISVGDTLIAYVYLDQANPPSEVMLQWKDSELGWDHRAYWGANQIEWGANGTNSRRWMGALPPVSGWTRLEVPASQVGLEGKTVNGMAFTLYGGRATWDRAGKVTPSSSLLPRIFTLNSSGIGAAVALNAATLKPGEFSVTTLENLGVDKTTRVMIFGSGFTNEVLSTITGDSSIDPGTFPNLAASVIVEARTSDNRVFQLPVEFVGPSGRSNGLDQINVRLVVELRGAGSVQLTLIVAGQRSNGATIKIV